MINLLAIEINLDSFFDVDLIVFTTISFVFSAVIVSFLVFALRPLNARARLATGKKPEKISTMYVRLLIYGFAQFIAFVADVFLVMFGYSYKLPWFTTTVFLTLMFYKLVFVLFKDFRDLGYNAEGITKTIKTASKVATDKNFKSLTETIDNVNMQNKETSKEKQKTKISRKGRTLKSKTPFILLFVFLSFLCGVKKYDTNFNKEIVVSNILIDDTKMVEKNYVEEEVLLKCGDKPLFSITFKVDSMGAH